MTHNHLLSIINSLDATKATGLDGVSPKTIKLTAAVIAPSLLVIINICIETGSFPQLLKMQNSFQYTKVAQIMIRPTTVRYQFYRLFQK